MQKSYLTLQFSLPQVLRKNSIHTSVLLFRYASVKPLINLDFDHEGSKKPWMKVNYAGREKFMALVRKAIKDCAYESDPTKAREISLKRFKQLSDSMRDNGECRYQKSYSPPTDVEQRVKEILKQNVENMTQNWKETPLDDLYIKFKFINQCSKAFDHELESSILHMMKTAKDVLEYYETPIEGKSPLDKLINDKNLPSNLHISPNYIFYNPNNDNFFGGKDALPGLRIGFTGIRGSKKYPNYKEKFEWPDV